MTIRTAGAQDLDRLAGIWYDGWQDAHARILPAALARYRTRDSFAQRLRSALGEVRVTGPAGSPTAFCITAGDELYQLYASAEARGTGTAAALLADGEARIACRGFGSAWLACGIGNLRAARFYEKHGWARAGNMISELPTPDGPFLLEVWRYEKILGGPA